MQKEQFIDNSEAFQFISHFVDIPQTNCSPKQVFLKLFDEVEKIHSWKVQISSDALQMDRRLQENKKTIETQRKAIQELQVWAVVPAFCFCSIPVFATSLSFLHKILQNSFGNLSVQFGNESLSMKLEEQISDNENLRNKYVVFFVLFFAL